MSSSSLSNFIPLGKLGEGTFSSVYQVRRVTDQRVYALKKIKIACLSEKEKANALNQIRILASLTQNYIISYKQAFFDEKLHLLCIIMEWANEGDLLKKIAQHRQRRHRFAEQQIWKAAYHILSGLKVLHKNAILHRDMKSANIFICDGIYKLGDLNVSKVNDHQQRLVKTQTGTPFYASPQVWRDEPYGSQSDIWSFGCIIYEMCCFRPPFNGKDLNELYKHVQRGDYEHIPKTYSKQLSQLIERCLNRNPLERPTAEELLREGEIIKQRCEFYQIQIDRKKEVCNKERLLQTIKMPFDIKKLNSKLPESKYQKDDEEEKGKTMVKSLPSSYLFNSPEYNKAGSNSNLHSNRLDLLFPPDNSTGDNPSNGKESMPQKIKNQLNKINKMAYQKDSRKNERLQKEKILSSGEPSMQRPIQHRLQDYLTPIKEYPIRKQRPFSCNYINVKSKSNQKSPYFINNLNRYANPSVNKIVYHSDRRPIIDLRDRNQLISDRRDGSQRDHYLMELAQKNKYRCRSANNQKPTSLSELKHRLEIKYNMKPGLLASESSQNKNTKLKQHIKSEASIRNIPNINSYAFPSSLSSHILRHPVLSKDFERGRKPQNDYLQEVQNKILANAKSKRSQHLVGYKGSIGQGESRLRRLVKGSNYYCKSSNRL